METERDGTGLSEMNEGDICNEERAETSCRQSAIC